MTSPKFDPEAERVYFIADGWATSGAICVLDLKTDEVKFFTDGDDFAVLTGASCQIQVLWAAKLRIVRIIFGWSLRRLNCWRISLNAVPPGSLGALDTTPTPRQTTKSVVREPPAVQPTARTNAHFP